MNATCPYCGAKNTGASNWTSSRREPRAGDCAVCVSCLRFCTFTEALGVLVLRKPTDDEFRRFSGDQRAQFVQTGVAYLKKHFGRSREEET